MIDGLYRYATRLSFPPTVYGEVLSRLSDIEYRLAFATSDKLQTAALVSAFVTARTQIGLELAKGTA